MSNSGYIGWLGIFRLGLVQASLGAIVVMTTSTLNRIMTGRSGVSPDMALRLSRALGRSPESWLALQNQFDLWSARNTVDLEAVQVVLESRPETPA